MVALDRCAGGKLVERQYFILTSAVNLSTRFFPASDAGDVKRNENYRGLIWTEYVNLMNGIGK